MGRIALEYPRGNRRKAPPGGAPHTELEQLVEAVLNRYTRVGEQEIVQRVLSLNTTGTRVVILGGGTGLSTIVGGNSQMPQWPDQPFVGLKEEFRDLDVVVCTTDDGGSTGRLLRQLPMIGIGDLRKSFVSLIRQADLHRNYRFSTAEALRFVRLIQQVFHFRFSEEAADQQILRDPLLAGPPHLRPICPEPLAAELRALGRYISPRGGGPTIEPAGHCLGNLLLTAAIFRDAGGATGKPPSLRNIREGLDRICRLAGVAPGRLHPATSTPGQLKFHYTNGVEVYGQSKSARARRGFPVEWLIAEFSREPLVSDTVLRAIRDADLIVYAPGSLYTSIIPILQVQRIVEAIRQNRKALKVLGANFWIQEGETDISLRQSGRGFLVSDLIEAYGRNVPGGAEGLFHIVLSANLERVPGNIMRSYALEGKSPIHLDRRRVEAMGFQSVEATLFLPDFARPAAVIHHDAGRFALAIRSLLYAWRNLRGVRERVRRRNRAVGRGRLRLKRERAENSAVFGRTQGRPLCDHIRAIEQHLRNKEFHPRSLMEVLLNLAWENRDIQASHLAYFSGARGVSASDWDRSTAWDNVLGYYDPQDRFLKVHEHILAEPERLREELVIALGESLLGRYIESKSFRELQGMERMRARCYEIVLLPESERECFLDDAQLRTYLALARLVPDAHKKRSHRLILNDREGFLPPGLLFGLMYAWYLNNSYAKTMEYEMSLLRWPPHTLIPHQAKERIRKQALVTFFRTEVFGQGRI